MIVEAAPDASSPASPSPRSGREPDSMSRTQEGFRHRPVMVDVLVDVFASVPAGTILDATVGGAGHARALLESRADIQILGIDRDGDAVRAARARLADFAPRAHVFQGRFDEVEEAMRAFGISNLSGALFDLGVSSFQLDAAERGFSYRFDAPLDMRMDQRQPLTAGDLVNTASEADLARVLRDFADERFASRIARAVVQARPLVSTRQLSDVVSAAIPAPARRRGGHPAKRTFQALRIAVNNELEVLPVALETAIKHVRSGGRVAVLSYHSGEDRIVKDRFARFESGGCECPAHLPCVCGALPTVRRVRVASKPDAREQQSNPRSSSARLRVVEVI